MGGRLAQRLRGPRRASVAVAHLQTSEAMAGCGTSSQSPIEAVAGYGRSSETPIEAVGGLGEERRSLPPA
jgi:hypothetical protein